MWITPYHQGSDFSWPLSFDDKLTIFSEQTLGWQLDIADTCINGNLSVMRHSGYAVLHIVFSYFEMIAIVKGLVPKEASSKKQFNAGVLDVFPNLSDLSCSECSDALKILYGSARCGLYHQARTRQRVALNGNYQDALTWVPDARSVVINPHKLVPMLKQHFHSYICSLRELDNDNLRSTFEQNFDLINAQDPLPITKVEKDKRIKPGHE